jgi:hypothetical protein
MVEVAKYNRMSERQSLNHASKAELICSAREPNDATAASSQSYLDSQEKP